MAGDGGFAAAGGADDEADVPGPGVEREVDGPFDAAGFLGWEIEEAADLLDARRFGDEGFEEDVHGWGAQETSVIELMCYQSRRASVERTGLLFKLDRFDACASNLVLAIIARRLIPSSRDR